MIEKPIARMAFGIRIATMEDIPAISSLIKLSARQLGKPDYSDAQIEGALLSAWGVDSQLVQDGTYFVMEAGESLAACGGWSRRKTLFGSDAIAAREPALLDPVTDSARIRAFFVHPNFARRGLGTQLLKHCEEAARREGFRTAELVATLPGEKLYSRYGYRSVETIEHRLGHNLSIRFVRMVKDRL